MSVRRECFPMTPGVVGGRGAGPQARGVIPTPPMHSPQVGVSAAEQQGRSFEQCLPRGAQWHPGALGGRRAGRGAPGPHQAPHRGGEEQARQRPVLRLRGCRSVVGPPTPRREVGVEGRGRTSRNELPSLQTPRGSAPTWACSPASSVRASTASWVCASRVSSPSPWTCCAPRSCW